jgi:hypothetical protein
VASSRLRKNRSIGSYLTSLEQTTNDLNNRQNYLTTGLASQSVGESALAEELAIFNRSIQTENYVEGYSGWRIAGNGDAEFGSVVVRGDINAYSGTIGYWNISTPAVSRIIGPYSLLGTFIESTNNGTSDTDLESGTYVALYKSYSPLPVVATVKSRTSNVATITAENHQFVIGDFVTIAIENDTTYNNGSIPVAITAVTNDTFSYSNVGTDDPESEATGSVQLYNPDVAGLYLRDYGKREFDYGYFSSAGVAYVSAEDINIIENPSFEYKSGTPASITYDTSSWTAGTGLTLAQEDFVDGTDPQYNYGSRYGGRVTWTTTGLTTYFEGTLDYSAGSDYSIFSNNRILYFGASVYPYYTVANATAAATPIVRYELTGSFSSANATASNVTYTGTSLNFAVGQVLKVTGFTGGNASRYNITANIISANSTTVVVSSAGTVETTSTGTGSASVGLFEATTTATHSFVAGDIVFFDFKFGFNQNVGEIANFLAPHTIPDPDTVSGTTSGYTFEVLAYPAPTSTTFYVSADNIYANIDPGFYYAPATIYLFESNINTDGTTRTKKFYRGYNVAIDISEIRLKYSNANTTPLSNVVSVATKAEWDASNSKHFITNVNTYMLGFLDPDVAISPMTKGYGSVPIIIDADALDLDYKVQDPTGYAAKTDITFQIPGWMYKHNGGGNVTATKITASSSIGYILDNLYLATNNRSYYGNNLDTNRWYDNTTTNTAQASVEGTKTWIDIDLATQDAQLNYLSRVGFKGTNFSKLLYSNPSISAITQETSKIYSYSESESLKFTSGEYQALKSSTQYLNIESYLQTQVSEKTTSFELLAHSNSIDINDGDITTGKFALVGGIYDYFTDKSQVTISADQFRFVEKLDTNFTDVNYIISANSTSVVVNANLSSKSLRLSNTDGVNLTSTLHAFQIGENGSANLRLDTNEIQAVNNGATASLYLNESGGDVVVDTFRVTSTTSYNLTSTTHSFQIGPDNSANLRLDDNGIQAASNGSASGLNINTFGGNIILGTTTSDITADSIYATSVTGRDVYVSSAGLLGYNSASSRRFKREITPLNYDPEKILNIEPVSFKYNVGILHKSEDPDVIQVGFIAEDLDEAGLVNLVDYDENGLPEAIQYSRYIVALQTVVRYQNSQIKDLIDRVKALESK